MKKAIRVAGLLAMTVGCLAACSKNNKVDDGTNHLEFARWDIEQINTARKKNTPLYKAFTEATGVDVSVMSVSSAGYNSKINVLYATESLPDVFVSTAWDTPSTFKKWIRDEAVVDYTKYVTAENYPNIYARIQKYGFLRQTLSYMKGGLYALPIETLPLHAFYVRTDWIENLNNKLGKILQAEGICTEAQYNTNPDQYVQYKFIMPTTLTDFYRLAYAFTFYDPDNNGLKDTFGYSCCTDNMWYNNWVFESMSHADKHDSAYWGYVETEDPNALTISWTTEGSKKSVYFLNKLYTEGILDPDFVRLSEQDCRTAFIQGSIGIYMENMYYNDVLRSFMETYDKTMDEAKQMFTCCVPPTGQYGQQGNRVDPGFWDGLCIANRLSDRKINLALKAIDYLCSPAAKELFTWGIEGVHYKVEGDKRISKMGTTGNGFNETLNTYDNAFPLSSFTNWDYFYKSPYESNYDFVHGLLEQMKAVRKHDPVCLLQPDAYVEYDLAMSQNSKEQYVSFIRDDKLYNSSAKKGMNLGDTDWDDLTGSQAFYTQTMNSSWQTFTNKLNNDWHGNDIINAMNALYPSVKQMYKDFFKTIYLD